MTENRISRAGQTKIYVGKCCRLFINEKQWKNLISTFLIMVLICMVTSREMFTSFVPTRQGGFAIVCACIWIGLFNSIQSVCRERDIVKREHRTGLHISSYIMAHVIYEAALCLAETVIVTLITVIRNITHLPPRGLIFPLLLDFAVTFFVILFSSDMIALLISCIVKKENTAMTVMPFVLIIQLIMSGMIFELSGLPKLISALTISRWGLNAICAIANTDNTLEIYCSFSGIEGCDPSPGNLFMLWLRLLFFAAVYIAAAIVMLKRVDKDKR